MSDKKHIGYSEDKKTIEYLKIFAETRGMKLPAFIRFSIYEVLRRKLPKDAVTVPFVHLHELVNGVGE
jgi:hypothetical protein